MTSQLCRLFIHPLSARSACHHSRALRCHEPVAIQLPQSSWQWHAAPFLNATRSVRHEQRKQSTLALGLARSTPGPTNLTASMETVAGATKDTPSSATLSIAETTLKPSRCKRDALSETKLLDLHASQESSLEGIGQTIGKSSRPCQFHSEQKLGPESEAFWTPCKEAQLLDLAAKRVPWTEVADALGTLPTICVQKHQQLLVLAMANGGRSSGISSSINHAHVATTPKSAQSTAISDANPTGVSRTVSTTMSTTAPPKKKKARVTAQWSPESDKILLEMRAKGATWDEVAQHIGREPATCLHRYESSLNPALVQFWTDDKVEQLDNLVADGKSWAEIARVLGVHRLACKEKWRLMGQAELEAHQDAVVQWAEAKRQQELERDQQQQRKLAKDELPAFKDTLRKVDPERVMKSWNELLRDSARYEHFRSAKQNTVSNSLSNLYLMNAGWAAKEEAILIQHVLRNGLHQWEEASAALNNRFSPEECRSCWKNLDMPVAMPEGDLEEKMQDSGLFGLAGEGTETNVGSTMPSKWTRTRATVEGVPLQADPQPEWTSDQQVHFWYLWREHGESWTAISKSLGDKSSAACKAYFQNITSIMRDSRDNRDDEGSVVGVEADGADIQDGSRCSEVALKLAKAITHNFTRKWKRSSSQLSAGGSLNGTVASDKKTRQTFTWTKARSVRLQAIMRQVFRGRTSAAMSLDDINWGWLAKHVHPRLTGRVCRNHWKYLHSMDCQWTQEDIRRLEEGIRLLGPRKLTSVRQHFLPHMTKDDVTRQWFRISDRATMVTEDEYYTLLGAIEKHGTEQWELVESEMPPGWKRPPCKRVWESSYQHLISKAAWTEDQDQRLLQTVEQVGRDDWFAVAKALRTQHSPWETRLRWCQLVEPIKLETPNNVIHEQAVQT